MSNIKPWMKKLSGCQNFFSEEQFKNTSAKKYAYATIDDIDYFLYSERGCWISIMRSDIEGRVAKNKHIGTGFVESHKGKYDFEDPDKFFLTQYFNVVNDDYRLIAIQLKMADEIDFVMMGESEDFLEG